MEGRAELCAAGPGGPGDVDYLEAVKQRRGHGQRVARADPEHLRREARDPNASR